MPTSPFTIAVVADLHYGVPSVLAERRAEIADLLLQRLVYRLNRLHQPDVTVVAGDVLDAGDGADAHERRARLRELLDRLASPTVVLPGNHDGDPDAFYSEFERPRETIDIRGVRLLAFTADRDEPDCNASRTRRDIERFRVAREGFAGPIVALQHVCLAPPEIADTPYNYVNAAEIAAAMEHAGVALSISGHYHEGGADLRRNGVTYVNAPALCEAPFRYAIITLDGPRVSVARHQLALPREAAFFDWHVHTPLAYCSENLNLGQTVRLARDFGLAGFCFTEHAGQLYFNAEDYWTGRCFAEGLAGAKAKDNRMSRFFDSVAPFASQSVRVGLEVDCDSRGRPVLTEADAARTDILIGAIHALPGVDDPAVPTAELERTFLGLLGNFLKHDFDILAHPFRVFHRAGRPAPEGLFRPVVDLLRKTGTTAELNCHTETPPLQFYRICLDAGVRLSLGSDAHNLCEIGDFAYQLDVLRQIGCGDAPADIFWKP
jgi:histidinol phosphatase-like PHP family hydrolase